MITCNSRCVSCDFSLFYIILVFWWLTTVWNIELINIFKCMLPVVCRIKFYCLNSFVYSLSNKITLIIPVLSLISSVKRYVYLIFSLTNPFLLNWYIYYWSIYYYSIITILCDITWKWFFLDCIINDMPIFCILRNILKLTFPVIRFIYFLWCYFLSICI